jgi:hypothetical protein
MVSVKPENIGKHPGELLHLVTGSTCSDYIYAIDIVREDGSIVAQDRKVKAVSVPELLKTRFEMIPDDMYVKNFTFGPAGEWFLQYANSDGTGDKAFWDLPNPLCSDLLQARFRSGEVGEFVIAFGPNLSYVILDGDQGFLISKNVPEGLRKRIMDIRHSKGMIYRVLMFPNGGYFIRDSDGIAISGAPPSLETELHQNGVSDVISIHVAMDYSWVLIRKNSFTSSGACPSLQRTFHAHLEHKNLYQSAGSEEIGSLNSRHRSSSHHKRAKSKPRENRKRKEGKSKKVNSKELELTAMKKKLVSQRITIAVAKGLKPGEVVTVVGFSTEPGDSTIERVDDECNFIVKKKKGKGQTTVEDLRSICLFHRDDTPRVEMVRLVKATDNFEAAVINLKVPKTSAMATTGSRDGSEGPLNDFSELSMFSRSSDNTPSTKEMSELNWDSLFQTSSKGWESNNSESESGFSNSGSVNPDKILSLLRGDTELQEQFNFFPVFESKGEKLLYDEYRCAEKIDFLRLELLLKDLKKDRSTRTSCIEVLIKRIGKVSEKDSKLCSMYLRKLNRCHELELVAETFHCVLKEYPITDEGFVIHEVAYEHRDEFCRGALFAVGKKDIPLDESRYPRNTTLQAVQSELLPILCGSFAHLVEIENSVARILCSLAQHLGLLHIIPTLADYRDNYQEWTSRLSSFHKITDEAARKWPNIIMMGEFYVYESWLRSMGVDVANPSDEIRFAFRLAVEVAVLSDEILRHKKFSWVFQESSVTETKLLSRAHMKVSMVSKVISFCQNEILSHVQRCCHNLGWIVRSKAFNSLIIEKGRDAKSNLRDSLKMCQTSCIMQGWDLKLIEIDMHGMQDKDIEILQEARIAATQFMKFSGQTKGR